MTDNNALAQCPKCGEFSGDDWSQCGSSCPMPGSPYYSRTPSPAVGEVECAVLLESLCAWLLHRFGPDSPEGQEAAFRLTKASAAIAAMQTTTSAERVRHKKRGTTYTIVGKAELQLSVDELYDGLPRGGVETVVYRGDDGKLWVRTANEFWDGRFERLTTIDTTNIKGD